MGCRGTEEGGKGELVERQRDEKHQGRAENKQMKEAESRMSEKKDPRRQRKAEEKHRVGRQT